MSIHEKAFEKFYTANKGVIRKIGLGYNSVKIIIEAYEAAKIAEHQVSSYAGVRSNQTLDRESARAPAPDYGSGKAVNKSSGPEELGTSREADDLEPRCDHPAPATQQPVGTSAFAALDLACNAIENTIIHNYVQCADCVAFLQRALSAGRQVLDTAVKQPEQPVELPPFLAAGEVYSVEFSRGYLQAIEDVRRGNRQNSSERESTQPVEESIGDIEESIRFGLINAEPFSIDEVIRVAVHHFTGSLPIDRPPERESVDAAELQETIREAFWKHGMNGMSVADDLLERFEIRRRG